MKYQFLVFDVDNTITESCSEITDEMAGILNKLREEIVFISGTHAFELKRMVSSKLNRKHHLLANVGTHYLLVYPDKEEEIYYETLDEEEKKEIILSLKKLKEEYKLLPLTSEEDQIQDGGSQITFSILGRNAPREMKESYDKDKEKRKKFVIFLGKIPGNEKYEFGIGGTTSIDITKKGNDKGTSLEKFMENHHLLRDELLFFGDQLSPGGNDYSVIKTGIKCIEVKNPEETMRILEKLQ
ncbi:hypothetical protein COU54_02805 [Candidatus Pacearchaeota archaeon CG10_big_fil_rev_8_21_14_0_10_31_24]|nr:MAG: hypothetical protein COU54_02805 [Candidatus Pacearchaeota archaeon CG10_big_fil_rev_8_21_14_0_10_31_24]